MGPGSEANPCQRHAGGPGMGWEPGHELAGSRGALVGAVTQAMPINDWPREGEWPGWVGRPPLGLARDLGPCLNLESRRETSYRGKSSPVQSFNPFSSTWCCCFYGSRGAELTTPSKLDLSCGDPALALPEALWVPVALVASRSPGPHHTSPRRHGLPHAWGPPPSGRPSLPQACFLIY